MVMAAVIVRGAGSGSGCGGDMQWSRVVVMRGVLLTKRELLS